MTHTHILKMNVNNFSVGLKIEDALRSFVRTSKNKYNITTKTGAINFYNDFIRYSNISIENLRNFNLNSSNTLANAIINKKNDLENEGWKFNCIKETSKDVLLKQLEELRKAGVNVDGHSVNINDYKNIDYSSLTRELVIYNVDEPNNPETTIAYPYFGARGGDNNSHSDHQEHVYAGHWAIQTGLNYYNARGILLEHYLVKTGEELKDREILEDAI